jgi:hypothetical protein
MIQERKTMRDIIPGDGYPPTNVLAKQGVAAVGGLAGGIALFVLGALPPLVGIIVGGIAAVVGIGALLSRDPADRKPGIISLASGALAILSKVGFARPLAGTLLGIGAIGLLAMGIWNGVKFLRGLKNRS